MSTPGDTPGFYSDSSPHDVSIDGIKSPGIASKCQIRPSAIAWQATNADSTTSSCGCSLQQRAVAKGQRGWKGQPSGGVIGFAISPFTGLRSRPVISMSG